MRLVVALALIFTLVSECAFSKGAITAEPYLSRCEQALAFHENGARTVEERLTEMAQSKEKMLQLLADYNVLFSKEFAQALVLTLSQEGILPADVSRQVVLDIAKWSTKSPEELNKLLWKAMDNMAIQKAGDDNSAAGQVKFLQAKNLVAALKASPNRPVFEELMQSVLRFSLLDYSAHLATKNASEVGSHWGDVAFLFILATSVIGTPGLIYYGTQIIPISVLGVIPGFFIGGSIGVAFDKVMAGRAKKKLTALQNPDSAAFAYKLVVELDGASKEVSDSVFKFLDREQKNGVLSLKDACNLDICRLSPVQVAYLGHVDVLQIEALNKVLTDTMKDVNVSEEIENISTLARNVYDNPQVYSGKMRLELGLKAFLEKMELILSARSKAVEALEAHVESVSTANLTLLGDKPYQKRPKTEEEIAKNQFLVSKIENDLGALDKIKLNNEALAAKIHRTQQVVENLKALLTSLPEGKEGWKDAASEVIARLDELR